MESHHRQQSEGTGKVKRDKYGCQKKRDVKVSKVSCIIKRGEVVENDDH